MYVDNENVTTRLKIVEERLMHMEGLMQLQDRRVNDVNKQLDHIIRQFQDFNIEFKRNGTETQFHFDHLEKTLLLVQKEIQSLANHQDERINSLINQLVEPSFKDIDYQIKQESQRIQLQCQRQLDDMYEEIINKFKTPTCSQVKKEQDSQILNETKKKIDEEINRRIQEENDRRRSFIESETKQHKNSQMSTEKSRAREIQNRLTLERKAKQDKINQLNDLYQFRKH